MTFREIRDRQYKIKLALNELVKTSQGIRLEYDDYLSSRSRQRNILGSEKFYLNLVKPKKDLSSVEVDDIDIDDLADDLYIDDLDELENFSLADVVKDSSNAMKYFFDLKNKIISIGNDFVHYTKDYYSVLGKKFGKQSFIDKDEEQNVVLGYKDSNKKLLQVSRELLLNSGFIDFLISSENRNNRKLELNKVFGDSWLQDNRDRFFSDNVIDNLNELETPIISAFWINKSSKLMEQLEQGFIYNRTVQDAKLGKYDVSNEDFLLLLAEKRLNLLKELIRYINKNYIDNEYYPDFKLSDYISYLYYKKDKELEYMVDDYEVDIALREKFETYEYEKAEMYDSDGVRPLTNLIMGNSQYYNDVSINDTYRDLFSIDSDNNDFTLLNDLLTVSLIDECKQELYNAKSAVSSISLVALVLSKNSTIIKASSPRWGINRDERLDENNRVCRFLIVDLPDYLKPFCLHITEEYYYAISNAGELPEYSGAFADADRKENSEYSVNTPFKLNPSEKSKFKKKVTEIKNELSKSKNNLNVYKKNLEELKDKTDEKSMAKKEKYTHELQKLPGRIEYLEGVYGVLREMAACCLKEHAKWLDSEEKTVVDD